MATINPHTTRATGTVLTAAIYNADHQNHITNANSLNAELITDTAGIANHEGRITTIEGSLGGLALPVGCIMDYGGAAAPSGWLLCFGQAISRATYAALFTAISTAYGAGDGTTTFNVPDFRGRVAAGQDDMGGTSANRLTTPLDGDTLGAAGGAESVALTTANLASHTHTGPSHTHASGTLSGTATSAGNHNHIIVGSSGIGGTAAIVSGSGGGFGQNNVTGTDGAHTHPVDVNGGATAAGGTGATGAAGSGTAHNNVQPTLIINKIIYTSV